MRRWTGTALGCIATTLTLASLCGAAPAATLANPAAVYCEAHGGKIEIETDATGGQKGVCVFANGTRIDEWVFFRNAHRTAHPL